MGNKYVRENKWKELEKMKIKLIENKKSKANLSLGLFLESVIETYNDMNCQFRNTQLQLSQSKQQSYSKINEQKSTVSLLK